MTTVTGYTSAAVDSLLSGKADLAEGVLPDTQAPEIAVKKNTWLVDIFDYGAHGDGVTSDDAAFISAMAAINPTWGGKLYLRPGKYLLTGAAAIALTVQGTTIEGAGAESSTIVIGSGFTGPEAISITAKTCRVTKLSISGANTTTTSNPVAGGIKSYGVRRTRIDDVVFWYVNGWAIENLASPTTGNQDGSIVDYAVIRQCAGGIHYAGATATAYAVNSMISNVEIIQGGVSTGSSANLDGVLIEDSWDVSITNLTSWISVGTGAGFHVKGNCAAIFVKNYDGLGSNTGYCVLVEDSTNGSPQNIQIDGGVIQQGLIGVRVTGGATKVNLHQLRFINNQTHGLSVEGTGVPIIGRNLTFETSGASASGTNYDINWSGSSTGYLTDVRFETAVVSSGTAGVQKTINVATSGQSIRCVGLSFNGTGSTSSNWFTNFPAGVFEVTTGTLNFATVFTMSGGATVKSNFSFQPSAQTNTVISSNTNGNSTYDTFRLTGDGAMAIGPGGSSGNRDSTWGRQGTAQIGTPDSDIIIGLAGKGLRIKEGTNARMGTATLTAGAVTIANTSITTNTRIVLATKTPGGTPGALFVNTVNVGTSFVVHSTSSTDTSVIGYVLFEAA